MANTLTYAGSSDGWTLQEFKTLVDLLASWHDPNNNRHVRRLDWDIQNDDVYVSVSVTDVGRPDIDVEIQSIKDGLQSAPNDWDTSDSTFDWG